MFFLLIFNFFSLFYCKKIIEIFSLDELNEYTLKFPIVFLFTLNINSNSYNSYKLASENLNAKFLVCHSKECINKYGQDIILLKQFDEKINYYLKFYEDDLNNILYINFEGFFIKYSVEAGSFLNEISLKLIFEFPKTTIIYFREDDDQNNLDKEFKIIVDKYKNNYYFLKSNLKEKVFEEFKNILEINELNGIYLFEKINEPNFKMYKYNYKDLNIENFEEFLKNPNKISNKNNIIKENNLNENNKNINNNNYKNNNENKNEADL